jgi:uncharacterized protein Yka (UPF0111/DUF47 family)
MLGVADTKKFLRNLLRLTSEGLRLGRSVRLIRDEVQAELARLFNNAEAAVLSVLVRHLGLTRMLATVIAEALADGSAPYDPPTLARQAKHLEEKADRLTIEARELCTRVHRASHLRQTIDASEDAIDALDEGVFLLSLMPREDRSPHIVGLTELADLVIDGTGQLVTATEAAVRSPQNHHADAQDSLRAIDAVIAAERRADVVERNAFRSLMGVPTSDARFVVLGLEVARSLETATDHLAHAALALRDRVLEQLSE